MRVATFNIRNVRGVDRPSWWFRRRGRLADAIRSIDVDVWGLQEAYASQIRYLGRRAFGSEPWEPAGVGRNRGGGGEAVPLWHRTDRLRRLSETTRWFGPTPEIAGSKPSGAQYPRIATICEYEVNGSSQGLCVVNLHLDSASPERRAESLGQLAGWLDPLLARQAVVVMGDFNGRLDEAGFTALTDLGMRSVLPDGTGPTANGFGRDAGALQQIDHVFVSGQLRVVRAEILSGVGTVSDHYPVLAELEFSAA